MVTWMAAAALCLFLKIKASLSFSLAILAAAAFPTAAFLRAKHCRRIANRLSSSLVWRLSRKVYSKRKEEEEEGEMGFIQSQRRERGPLFVRNAVTEQYLRLRNNIRC